MSTLAPLSVRAATRYTAVAITLHWLIGALLLFEVGLGLRMEGARGAARFATFQFHKSIGITILLLVALRLVWRWRNTPPPLVHSGWERTLAHAVHILFYVLLFALPLSGWLIVSSSRIVVPTLLYGTIPWPHLPGFATMTAAARDGWNVAGKFVHHNGINLIYALFALHLAGVAKHQFIDRDADLSRMAPGIAPGAWRDPRIIAIFLVSIVAVGLGLQWLPIGGGAMPITADQTPIAAAPSPASAPAGDVDPANGVAPTITDNATVVADNASTAVAPLSPNWKIAPGSTLGFATNWSGDSIAGTFARFSGTIRFDPDQLEAARVEIAIPVATAATGDAQRDETLQSADWFSASSFGNAVFKASKFRKTGNESYVASGSLTLKGTTLPISMPFTLKIDGDKATMHGTATVDRTAYKVGEGEYAGTSEIPAAVKVSVTLHATRRD